ncbi:MAG TPA: SDR family NAD(P)-dependent oxidoreductase [Solirubrobacteraceae bacterium]|jgi:NAD(P)-dependent dehydrogenase (short-subunit alcohol dehydrogenase family)|nr:SDR family NAD(P)-dependent oxidoreductase [Solirubrobacteraceae bacterium]
MARQLRALNSQVVAITGGARGIGRASAAALLARGARVAIGDLDAELTRRVAQELGAGAIGLGLDVTSRESFSGFLDRVERELGPLDVLVNNAGIAPLGEFAREPDAIAERVLEVNVAGTMRGCKLALERMLPRGAGHIVNVSSGLGRTPSPGIVTYAASKHAIVGLTESLRIELDGSGVELHLILPNLTGTDMSDGVRALRAARIVTPEAVAAAIVAVLQSGRREAYVPRQLGWLVRLETILPRAVVQPLRGLLGANRMFTNVDALERAAYEARIAPPAAAQADRAANVASAAASVADALRAEHGPGDHPGR